MTSLAPPPFHLGTYLGQQAGAGLQQGVQNFFKQREQVNQLKGLSPFLEASGLGPEQIEQVVQSGVDPQTLVSAMGQFQKAQAEGNGSGGALETLNRMKAIQRTGHLGKMFSFTGTPRKKGSTFDSQGQQLRAEYERLGKSLIQYSSNIPIRNRQEFETLAESLYDPNLTNEQIKGNLDAMDQIIRRSGGGSSEASPSTSLDSDEKFTIMKSPEGKFFKIPNSKVNQARKAGAEVSK